MGKWLKMVCGYTQENETRIIGQIAEQIEEAQTIEDKILELEMNIKRCDSMLKELIDKLNREVFDNYLEEVTDIDVDNFEKLNRKIRAITATRKILQIRFLGLMQKQ